MAFVQQYFPFYKPDLRFEADTAAVDRLAREMPGVYNKACGRAASGLRRKLRAILWRAGGKDGVPRLQPRAHGFPAEGRALFEGRSVDLRNMVYAWRGKDDGMQYIGWPHKLQDFVGRMLDAERKDWTPAQAEWVARRSRSALEHGYDRPARPVIEPFAEYVRANLPHMIAGAANKILAKTTQKDVLR